MSQLLYLNIDHGRSAWARSGLVPSSHSTNGCLINYIGNSLVDVLYGDVNPSGRLPYTIGKASTDYSAQVIYESTTSTILQIPYNEGILVDYRHFDQVCIQPLATIFPINSLSTGQYRTTLRVWLWSLLY